MKDFINLAWKPCILSKRLILKEFYLVCYSRERFCHGAACLLNHTGQYATCFPQKHVRVVELHHLASIHHQHLKRTYRVNTTLPTLLIFIYLMKHTNRMMYLKYQIPNFKLGLGFTIHNPIKGIIYIGLCTDQVVYSTLL